MAAPPAGGTGRGGEIDAQREVRLRMPLRFLGGAVAAATELPNNDAEVVLFPTIENVVALAPLLERVKSDGRSVILDSDGDLIAGYGLRELKPAAEYLSPDETVEWRGKYVEMVRAADAVTVATPYLADRYRAAGARQVFICPNAIDPDQWVADPWRPGDENPLRSPDRFTVGYAGGPGHEDDLGLVKNALRWVSYQQDAEAVIFGAFNRHLTPDGRGLETKIPAGWGGCPWRYVDFTPRYDVYRYKLTGLLDVGLMPLYPGSDRNRGRSDLKICELAMAGALPIVSDVPNYQSWKDTPVLFARGPGDFRTHVEWAAANRDEVRERAMAVREIVLRDRAMPDAVEPWRVAVEAASPRRSPAP